MCVGCIRENDFCRIALAYRREMSKKAANAGGTLHVSCLGLDKFRLATMFGLWPADSVFVLVFFATVHNLFCHPFSEF